MHVFVLKLCAPVGHFKKLMVVKFIHNIYHRVKFDDICTVHGCFEHIVSGKVKVESSMRAQFKADGAHGPPGQ